MPLPLLRYEVVHRFYSKRCTDVFRKQFCSSRHCDKAPASAATLYTVVSTQGLVLQLSHEDVLLRRYNGYVL